MDIENAKPIRVRDILALDCCGIIHFCTDSLGPDESVFMTIRCDNDGNYNLSALTNYILDQVVTDITYADKRNTLILEVENSNPYRCDDCKHYCDGYCKFIPDSEWDEKTEGPRERIKYNDLLEGCECWCDKYVSGLYRSEEKEARKHNDSSIKECNKSCKHWKLPWTSSICRSCTRNELRVHMHYTGIESNDKYEEVENETN